MTNTLTIKSALTFAATLLNTDEATLEAQLLLQHVLNVNRAWLIAHQNDALDIKDGEPNAPGHPLSNSSNEFDSPCIHAAYRALINRRINGEPIAYILGVREFYGLSLKVTPATLIPRPDTETLVEAALAKIPPNSLTPSFPRRRESMLNLNQKMDSRLRGNDELTSISEIKQPLRILDLGTGSGAIALAIAKHRPQAFVTAVDASENALKIAKKNAQNLEITNIEFVQSNWFGALQLENMHQKNNPQKFDVIVSNPPYIEANDAHLSQGDLRFEPVSALVSGAGGLDDIRNIIANAPQHLNPDGWLLLEHGYNQAEQVAALLKQAGFSKIETLKDLGDNNRVTLGKLC